MKLYLHPLTSIVDAAIAAYAVDMHVSVMGGKVILLSSSDALQYRKALQARAFWALAHNVNQVHTRPLNI